MPDFYFLGGEIVHYPLSNGVDEVSEQFFFAQTGFNSVCCVLNISMQRKDHLKQYDMLFRCCQNLVSMYLYGQKGG